MKSNTFKGIIAGAVLLQLVAPAFAHAEMDRRPKDGIRPAGFCERIAAFQPQINERIYDRETKLAAVRKEHEVERDTKRGDRDEMLAKKRMERDEKISLHYEKIEAQNLTDEQRAAVEAFKIAHATAVANRKAAVDTAIKAFRDGVESATASHKSRVDGIISEFKADIQAAYDKAHADCVAGASAEEVKAALTTAIKAAKDEMLAARRANDARGDLIKPLIETRNAAFKKAFEDFKAAIEKAKADLRVVFPKTDR